MEIQEKVHELYWEEDLNCAATTLQVLGDRFGLEVEPQLYEALIPMPGVGKHGATCGIVTGALMFISLYGKALGWSDEIIRNRAHRFVDAFVETFNSMDCRTLRPEGFRPENPPHLCEGLTVKAITFAEAFVKPKGLSS